jgi:prepilin-type N-terminal cleavage/methylation domain-containing protein
MGPHRATRLLRRAGFTLIELVMVIAIIGAMAVFVLPRWLDLSMWRLRAFGDELQAQMAAMQRLALLQRRPVTATISPTGVAFAYVSGASLLQLDCPPEASPCIAEAGTRSVTFNASNSGRASTSTGVALPITVSFGGTATSYVIEAQTGLFRPAP